MLKQLLNECTLKLRIEAMGPILVKSGIASISGPDMSFVKTYRNGKPEPYIPGSSLKGVFRSHVERIINTINDTKACVPYETNTDDPYCSCGNKFKNEENRTKQKIQKSVVYQNSCPVCKLFGSTHFVGRISISDAYAVGKPIEEPRDCVAIDRYTGGNAGKFDIMPVVSGSFETSIYLRNFEIWQLGLLMIILKDLEDGYIYIGMGKSRGFGKVTAKESDFKINVIGNFSEEKTEEITIPGVGALYCKSEDYKYEKNDKIKLKAGISSATSGIRKIFSFDSVAFKELNEQSIQNFYKYITSPN
jgi:CRISPR-associated RAMP protein (TIGR02581 family)